jgi:hypothetical protein
MKTEGLRMDYLSGLCPVQSEGFMDGFPFYFRARHNGWSITVTAPDQNPIDAWVNAHLDGVERCLYHNAELFDDAGYMELEVARKFIEREYAKFCAELAQAVEP